MVTRNRVGLNRDYFALPHPLWMIFLSISLPFLFVTAFAPDIIPPYLGVVRTAALYLANNYPSFMFYWAVFIIACHIVETSYAWKLCYDADMNSSATIKWILSTAIFGFTSVLMRLKPYLQRAKRSQF